MLCDFAARSETAVKGPISIVASQRKIIPRSNGGSTHGNDLAVWLNQQGLGLIRSPSKVSRYLAPRTEASVEVSVCFIAGEAKIATPPASHYDSSVGLKGNRPSYIKEAKTRREFATRPKARIQTSIRVIARQRKVSLVRITDKTPTYDHDLAVRLNGNGISCFRAAKVCFDSPATAETRIQATVRVVTGEPEIVRAGDRLGAKTDIHVLSYHHDFAVWLNGYACRG